MKTLRYLLLRVLWIALPGIALNLSAEEISLEFGNRITIDSQVLNEQRNLLVHLPKDYQESDKNYPVLFLLDGNRHFKHATLATSILAQENRIPEVIVVGITNASGKRGRDLSREKDQFAKFIQLEVINYIDKNYRTTGLNTLFGHSLAGYFTINLLANQPDAFKNYIAASPVLQANDSETYSQYLEINKAGDSRDNSLYFTLTGQEEEGKEATVALNNFVELLKEKSPHQLKWHYQFIADQVHMTTPYLTLYEGLNNVFKNYQAPRFLSFSEYKKSGGMQALKDYYKKRSDIYGTDKKIPLNTLSELANVLLEDGQTELALKMNINLTKNYPDSALAFNGLGEVYKSMKLYKKSIAAHEEAVRLSTKLSAGWQRYLKSQLEEVKTLK